MNKKNIVLMVSLLGLFVPVQAGFGLFRRLISKITESSSAVIAVEKL